MKKMFFIAVFLLSIFASQAQLNFGIKGGYNSSLSFDNISTVKSGEYDLSSVKSELSNGLHIGAFTRLGIKKVYIQPEVLYSFQRKEYELTILDAMNQDVTVDKLVTFSTIDIPILIGYKLVDLKLLNLRVFAGPKFRLNAGSAISFDEITNDSDIDTDALEGEFKNAQIGLETGAGIDVLMLTLDFKLNLINDIYTPDWAEKPALNSNFVISLGWKIF